LVTLLVISGGCGHPTRSIVRSSTVHIGVNAPGELGRPDKQPAKVGISFGDEEACPPGSRLTLHATSSSPDVVAAPRPVTAEVDASRRAVFSFNLSTTEMSAQGRHRIEVTVRYNGAYVTSYSFDVEVR
jgi:hypothetical protein